MAIYPKGSKIEKDTCTPMFTSALYIITSMWKQHISNRWMDKEAVVHIHGSGLVAQLCPTLAVPWTTRLLYPWDFPGKNTGVGSHFLLQGIFLTQESNTCVLRAVSCIASRFFTNWVTRELIRHTHTHIYIYKGILLSHKKKCIPASSGN